MRGASEKKPAHASGNGKGTVARAVKAISVEAAPPKLVAVGASAGGRQAFQQMLQSLPESTGFAFVLLQHLDPKHQSLLPELLRRATWMPVEAAQDGTRPEPDHVYILPPNKSMRLSKGRLRLEARASGHYMPIDTFMLSLAEEREDGGVIGVVLSGTATDGTLGLGAIKGVGGITFAQNTFSAQFEDMPRNAIAAGCADFVLEPSEIARELTRLARHPHWLALQPQTGAGEESLQPQTTILNLLLRHTGMDFTQYRSNTIHRRISRRMALLKFENLDDYIRLLQGSPEEARRLAGDLLIPATHFFRDAEVFELLQREAFPRLLRDHAAGQPIRVWSLGCSGGEETYSLAICWFEYLSAVQPHVPLQFFGTDLSEAAIARARQGRYPADIVHDVSPERLQRFFIKEEHGYRISKIIRDACIFARHNVLREPPFSHLDLISCRNVLIYMEPPLQRRIFPLLHYALRPNGMLLLGSSESAGSVPGLFAALDRKAKLYTRTSSASGIVPLQPARPFFAEPGHAAAKIRNPGSTEPVLAEAERQVLERFTPPGVIIDSDFVILHLRGDTHAFLAPAAGPASMNLLKMVPDELAAYIRRAVRQAAQRRAPVLQPRVQILRRGRPRHFALEVLPLQAGHPRQPLFQVLFRELPGPERPQAAAAGKDNHRELPRLRQSLAAAQKTLRSLVEERESTRQEFQAANEEIASANEALQSTNEELETSKEELQSANEELNTVNEELRRRVIEQHQTNNDLNNLLNAVEIPILMLDRELRVRRATPAAERIFRLLPADIGRRLADLRPHLEMTGLNQLMVDVLTHGALQEKDLRDNEGHWLRLRLAPYRTSENETEGLVLSLLDVDALKREQNRLRHSLNLTKAIINTMREPLLVLNENFKIVAANKACDRLYGMPVRGRSFWEAHGSRAGVPPVREALRQALRAGLPVMGLEVEQATPRGWRKLRMNAQRLWAAQPSLLLIMMEDVTESEETLRSLLAAERIWAAGSLTSVLAHEINTPLNALTQSLFLLGEHLGSADQKAWNYVEIMRHEMSQLTQIIREILSLYQTRAPVMDMRPADALLRAIGLLSNRYASRRIEVRSDFRGERTVQASPDELTQALANLLAAEERLLDEHGAMHLRVRDGRDWANPARLGVRIRIVDNASTPYNEEEARIFEPMLTHSGAQAAGVRLWLTRQIVEKYRGSIRVRVCRSFPSRGRMYIIFLPSGAPWESGPGV